MPSTFTSNMHLEIMGTGDKVGAWGPTNNSNLKTLERGITGIHSLSLTGTAYTLATQANLESEDPSLSAIVILTGTPTVGFTLTIPAKPKTYSIINTTAQDITVTCGTGPTITLKAANSTIAACTATGVYAVGAPGVGGSDASSITSGVFDVARIPTISRSKMETMPATTLIGNITAGAAVPEALTVAQVKNMLDVEDADIVTLMGGLKFWSGTQAAYDAIGTKIATTIYFITA